MNFTFAALSVIVGSLLARQVPDLLAAGVAILVVPLCAKSDLLIWLGEYRRTIRASHWLAVVEDKQWNGRDISKRESKHMTYPYVAIVILLMAVSYLGHHPGPVLPEGWAHIRSAVSRTAGMTVTGSTLLACVAVECVSLPFCGRNGANAG